MPSFFFEAKSVKVLGLIIHPSAGASKWISTPGVFPCRPKMGQSLKTSWACWADAAIHPVLLINISLEKMIAVTFLAKTPPEEESCIHKRNGYTRTLRSAQTHILISVWYTAVCQPPYDWILQLKHRSLQESDKSTGAGVLVWILVCHRKWTRVVRRTRRGGQQLDFGPKHSHFGLQLQMDIMLVLIFNASTWPWWRRKFPK